MVTAMQSVTPVAGENHSSHPAEPLSSSTGINFVELERATVKCVQDLLTAQRMPLEALLKVVEKNRIACENLAGRAAGPGSRVRQLAETAHRELGLDKAGEDASGTFSDFLAGLGFGPEAAIPGNGTSNVAPPARAPAQQARPLPLKAGTVASGYVDAVLEELQQGPRRAMREALRLLRELEDLRRRFNKLRSYWSSLQESIRHAYSSDVPLQIASLKWTLNEALAWRRRMMAALSNAEVLAEGLQDAIDRHRQEYEENRRWKAKARELLTSCEQAVSARIVAVTWLRKARIVIATASGPPVPGAPRLIQGNDNGSRAILYDAPDTFTRNLEVAEAVQRRLVKCAGAVMRVEPEHTTVQRAVSQLAELKTGLLETADAAAVASDRLMDVQDGEEYLTLVEEAADALSSLTAAVDEAVETLSDCPLPADVGAAAEHNIKDGEALRAWLQNSLLAEPNEEDEE